MSPSVSNPSRGPGEHSQECAHHPLQSTLEINAYEGPGYLLFIVAFTSFVGGARKEQYSRTGLTLLVPVSQAVRSGYERRPVAHRSPPCIAGPHANILHIKVDVLRSGSAVAPGRHQDPATIVKILGLDD